MQLSNRLIGQILGILGLIFITISTVTDIVGSKITVLSWIASVFILLSFTYIRFKVVNIDDFTEKIEISNLFGEIDLKPSRFLKWMNIALLVGLIATVTIHYNFIIGMLTYLIMHICLILAFSGLFPLNPLKYIQDGTPKMKSLVWFSIIFWLVSTIGIFIGFVYNGSESLVVVPYILLLGLMAHYSWYGLAYPDRKGLFSWMIAIGSVIFVFSDSLIGNHMFGGRTGPDWLYYFIDFTYVVNLFLMSQAILYLKVK